MKANAKVKKQSAKLMEKIRTEVDEEKDLREHQAEKITDFLTRIGAYEYVHNLVSNLEQVDKPSFEEFRDFLVRINGIARDIPINQRATDGRTVYLSGFDSALVPKHDDKEIILKEAYDSLDKINSGDEAYLLPAVVNAVHLFADGNGRTSRILHTLLESKSEEEFTKKLKLAIGYNGRYDAANINPAIVSVDIDKIVLMRHGIQFEGNKEYSPIFPEGFGLLFASIEEPTMPKAKQFMDIRKIDQPYCFVSAYEYLKEKGILQKVLLKIPSGLTLSPLKMEQELTETDWDEIINRYYQIKKEEVEILIDAFVKPESYKNLNGSMNLRDYFLKEIKKRFEEFKKA